MSYILYIDTAQEIGYIGIVKNTQLIVLEKNINQHQHAQFIHATIQKMCINHQINMQDFVAVAVVAGPGSYTGIKVGLSAAKGICFALNILLIQINSLKLLANTAINKIKSDEECLIIPMIDARRNEAYFAIYNLQLHALIEPQHIEVTDHLIPEHVQKNKIIFLGSGTKHIQNVQLDYKYEILDIQPSE
ncbi:MAG: tRNA (adenosine(37)-N6)-threonylcarbamoyltransferase complex dimerization subunit type 1 TsaB, partial [Sediminibacterium sp.]|nr:tRNA (adenosine(37)-N6)-threonylcarbamoyltransferase complex dimerization subunit type 1 TsaB [Sediminibacterium sp.]